MVEATKEEWVHIPASEEGTEDIDEYREKHKRFGYDRSLLTCLVDRWRPETHTFHFPWGEMAPTLQDVSYLLGLPLAGQAIGPLEVPDNWREDMQARFAGLGPADGMVNLAPDPHGPRFLWLSQFQVNQ
jgi:hypothetical protein